MGRLDKWNTTLSLLVVLLMSGCATNYTAQRIEKTEEFAEQKKWSDAYAIIENDFLWDYEHEKISLQINKYPEIITVGMKESYRQRLDKAREVCNKRTFDDYYYNSILVLGKIRHHEASKTINEILGDSKKWLNDCAANPDSSAWLKNLTDIEYIVGPDYFSPNTKRQAAITEEKETQSSKKEATERTGIIISVQVSDKSHINNGSGANLGAAIGQANYIDNANWRNYSATKQLGAGLVGAMIGGIAMDRPSKVSYQTTYFVKLLSGEIKQVAVTSSSATHFPEGICVEAFESNINIVNQNNCAELTANQR